MPAQVKVFGICLLLIAGFGGGLYAAVNGDDSLTVSSQRLAEGTVLELVKTEGMDLRYSGGRGRSGADLGKTPGIWIATVELADGNVVRVLAGNPPVTVGEEVDVNVSEFENGDLSGTLVSDL